MEEQIVMSTKKSIPSDLEYQKQIERQHFEASKRAATDFMTNILCDHPDQAWVLEGFTLLFDLFGKPDLVADVRDLAEDLQELVWKFTHHHDRALQAFRDDVTRRANWLPGVL